MCLAIPGRVVLVTAQADPLARRGVVDLQGSRIDVSLALVPSAAVGTWVLVHAGYAIEQLDEEAARETWHWLREARLVEGELPAGRADPAGEGEGGDAGETAGLPS